MILAKILGAASLHRLARQLFALAIAVHLVGIPVAGAATWRPAPVERRFDIQLSQPFNLARPADALALELFGTSPERVGQLRARGVAPVCRVAAGLWENWRPDAGQFPKPALGRSPTGWQGQRWLDVRNPALRPILAKRLDLCRQRGFDGVLLAGLDGYARDTGFDLKPTDQLAFNRWLAEAAHARGLAAGIVGDLVQAADLAPVFDFLVDDTCATSAEGCAAAEPFRAAGKPVFLIAYTNAPRKMDAACAAAAEIEAPLIFKTQYPNGKLHRRCA
jgi:hypothetical protein